MCPLKEEGMFFLPSSFLLARMQMNWLELKQLFGDFLFVCFQAVILDMKQKPHAKDGRATIENKPVSLMNMKPLFPPWTSCFLTSFIGETNRLLSCFIKY